MSWILTLLASLGLLTQAAAATPPDEVDFAGEILPLLEARCVRCHGPGKQKAGLRLDTRAAALGGSAFGETPVIVPGDAAASPLWLRVSHADEDERMPPSGEALSAEELGRVRRWIDAGAPWPDELAGDAQIQKHWAYVAPTPAALPPEALHDPRFANPIDGFASAARGGQPPGPSAEPARLARRVSLDLTGLPPAPEVVAAFEADPSDAAYARLVDTLLASPHYGEHQAAAWLDQARYADSQGYEKDSRRTMWRWRDWVIGAFNADMPFDRFTTEQLAGDLLPEPTLDQLVATGFHRNTMVNSEGGADPEEFRVAAVVDRVDTTARVWLGASLGCARCHDHKFDPFKQREYYQLFAFFNQTEDVGNSDAPMIEAPTPAAAAEHARVAAEIAALDARLATQTPALDAELDAWLRAQGRGIDWLPLRPESTAAEQGSRLAVLDDHSVLAFGELPGSDTYVLRAPVPAGASGASGASGDAGASGASGDAGAATAAPFTGLRLEVLTDESLPDGGPGRPSHQNFVLNELTLELIDAQGGSRELALASAVADHEQEGSPAWPAAAAIDGDPATGWAIGGGTGSPHQLVVALERPLLARTGDRLRARLEQGYGSGHLIGRLRLGLTRDDVAGPGALVPPDIEALLARRADAQGEERRDAATPGGTVPAEPEPALADDGRRADADLSADDRARLEAWFRGRAPSLADARDARAALSLPTLPTALVMRDGAEPRETHLLLRGSFLSPGERVQPDVPAVLHPMPNGGGTRLDLARWLMADDNPLTARVTVNRHWARLFGTGLVATEDDFGTMGEVPSHPALLDWLALEFQRTWSVKALLRTIVTSRTYRQSSAAPADAWRDDPGNRRLARGPRLRVSGETVRDIALAASGLLCSTIGGPSVFPPQPEGTWAMTYSSDRWEEATGDDRHRRGMYTFWRRTSPYPTFQLFDAPSRELSCTRRDRTNTPLQALATLNDPAFVECARSLARRLLAVDGASDVERIERGFRLCVSRAPSAADTEVLLTLAAEQRAAFAARPDQAALLVEAGARHGGSSGPNSGTDTQDANPFHDAGLPDAATREQAVWTVIAGVLLNLDETLTKG